MELECNIAYCELLRKRCFGYKKNPSVMNTPEGFQQAFEDYQLGRMGELAA